MEKVDDPVDGVDDMDYPREVVDDVKKCVFVLDRLNGLIGIEDEEDGHHEEVQEAEYGAPVTPQNWCRFQNLFGTAKGLYQLLIISNLQCIGQVLLEPVLLSVCW